MEQDKQPQSLLAIVKSEEKKARRDAAKQKVKGLFTDLTKARDVVSGIEAQIVEVLTEVGESEADIRSLLME